MPFRFVHTADLHLDSPLRSLALRNADLAEVVRGASRTALTRIVDLCLAESVDALLIAGDLYDGSQTSMNTALFLASELRRLEAAGIRVFIIRGNHDSQSSIKRELALPDNVNLFTGRSIKPVPIKVLDSGKPVYIHGIGFDEPHAPDSLLPRFHAPVADAVNIGMLHTSLAGAPGHDPYAPCSIADLTTHGFDYWALGHVHLRQVHTLKPLIVMPGIPQGRDINEDGAKSVTLVSVADDGTFTHEERPVGQAVFQRLAIDLTGVSEWRDMLATAGQSVAACRQTVEAEALILRVALVGMTPLAWTLRRDPDYLLADLANIAAGTEGCWIEKVEVSCRSAAVAISISGPDPLSELADLIRTDILPSHAFRQDVAGLVNDLVLQLPRELRETLAGDEVALERLVSSLSSDGSDDVLASLHGGEETDR